MADTDEIMDNDDLEKAQEKTNTAEVGGDAQTQTGYENNWGARIMEFATDTEKFKKQFTQAELGHGQSLDLVTYSKKMAEHQGRERAGKVKGAAFKADRAWVEADTEEQKLVGSKLKNGIARATNVVLANELAYRVGVIPLHGELRHNQLKALSNKVRSTRVQVNANDERLAIEGGSTEEIDFTKVEVEVEEDELV